MSEPSASAPLAPLAADSDAGFRRLHPLSPLIRGARGIGVVLGLVSYQAWGSAGWRALAIAACLIVLGWFVVAWVAWRFTGFRVAARELHVRDGILSRRQRTIPLERVQAVDVVRPALGRLFGLAEVRMEVVGGGKDAEAPLAYLTTAEAEQLRVHLLRLAADAGAPATPVAPSAPSVTTAVGGLFRVDHRRLILSQLLTVNTLSAPFLLVFPILEFTTEDPSAATVFTFVSGIVGLIQVPVRRLLGEWGFTVGRDADGLRVHRGMLDVRNQTIPIPRIQAVRIRQPLLWRPFGWVRIEIDVAGYGAGGQQESGRSALVPVAPAAEAFAVLHAVLPTVPADGPDAIGLHPAPVRARWRAPFQYRRLAYAITDTALVTRSGWLTARHDVALHARAQSIRITQGPWQRALDLASVRLDPAGGHTTPTVLHQETANAARVATDLVDRARTNRAPATEPTHPADLPPAEPDLTAAETALPPAEAAVQSEERPADSGSSTAEGARGA
ncbi:PH domain-containing protein [Cryptosporangium aurantiacum]|uniref:Putative membrane protein n=1 Tax=Cryptosporangium aurantiacum TaxID=134849 RepID=A0A1M7JBG8_9ACTN|nr:PH domain-containing protein [Cryptosporangium aurantiacum]SHM50223.1 putative membrane protein [Cryptosporangium aurantiacum]